MFIVPEASMSCPAELSKSRVTVRPGPEITCRLSSARSITTPAESARLISTERLEDDSVNPARLVTLAPVAEAF